jgi:hypothetical protein
MSKRSIWSKPRCRPSRRRRRPDVPGSRPEASTLSETNENHVDFQLPNVVKKSGADRFTNISGTTVEDLIRELGAAYGKTQQFL